MCNQDLNTFALDANCFIDAFNGASSAFQPMQTILQAQGTGRVRLAVSLHTIAELSQKRDQALALAQSLPVLPHFPIGNIKDQVSTISAAAGTFDDVRRNDSIQRKLALLANAGTDIRDRGAYIDAIANDLPGFITSDRALCADGPMRRINAEFRTKVLTPAQLAFELRPLMEE